MSKHSKVLEQIKAQNASLDWSKVEALLKHYGAEVIEGKGSAVTFVLGERKFTMHRPHPRRDCGRGLIKRVRSFLKETKHL